MRIALGVNACYLLFELGIRLVRIACPARRRWPTVYLNMVLLLWPPFGTILGIYGLWKVDKGLA